MQKKKTQILLIHGGMTFKNRPDYLAFLKNREITLEKKKRWQHEYLDQKLGSRFEIIRPRMPLADNARYEDWKIHFERYIPLLHDGVILMGISLGGIFLAKNLSEHRFPKKIGAVYLVCPPFDNSVAGEDLVGGFHLNADLSLIAKNTKTLRLFFSADDEVVPVSHAEKYRKKLPSADITVYKSKNGHFGVPSFPELVKLLTSNAAMRDMRHDKTKG